MHFLLIYSESICWSEGKVMLPKWNSHRVQYVWESVWNTLKKHLFIYIFFHFKRQLNLLSTATPAVGAWLVPIDQLKSSLNKLETEGTLRICAVMGCIMTEALEVCLSTMQSVIQSLLLEILPYYLLLLENIRPASF